MTQRSSSNNSLSHLYEYRIVDETSHEVLATKPNRYQVATTLASMSRQNKLHDAITAQRKVNGQWVFDGEAHTLADKHAQKPARQSSKPVVEKQYTLKDAMRDMQAALRVALTASELTEEHIDAVAQRQRVLDNALQDHFDNYQEPAEA